MGSSGTERSRAAPQVAQKRRQAAFRSIDAERKPIDNEALDLRLIEPHLEQFAGWCDMADERTEPDEAPTSTGEHPHYSAHDVRGGEIILRTRARRWIFIAGLVGFVVIALVARFASGS